MVSDGSGGAYVVWRLNAVDGNDLYVQRLAAGLTVAPGWPPDGVPVVVAPYAQEPYELVADGTGGVMIAWADQRASSATSYDIYLQRFLGDGRLAPGWPVNGLPVCIMSGMQTNPSIVSDGAGGAIIAWEDGRDATDAAPYHDIYAARVRADGTLAPGWLPNGNPINTAPNSQFDPVVLEDGAGGAIIAWSENGILHLGEILYPGVRAVRVTEAAAVAPGWPAAGVPLSSAGIPVWGRPRIVTDGEGGAIVAWQDYRNVPHDIFETDIFAQRVRADGTLVPGWPVHGATLCQAPDTQWDLEMVSDGAGGAVAVWTDYRFNVGRIYGQRVTGSGAIANGWLTDGNPLSTAPSGQYFPKPAFDGAGAVTLAMVTISSTGSYDLLSQRVRVDGSFPAGWSLTPRPLCLGEAENYQPTAASDGAGGLIVVSLQTMHPDYDLYASWVPGGVVATSISLASVEVAHDRVLLAWYGTASEGLAARVERRTEPGEWTPLALLTADGQGVFRYEDRAVHPGQRYGYRLRYWSGDEELATAEEWVAVPAPRFALAGAVPNPVVADLVVEFSLADAGAARLEVFDLAGRQVAVREVGSSGPGTHRVGLTDGRRLPAGMYLLALTQGAQRAVTRAVVVR